MNLRQLEAYRAVMVHGGITAAARALDVSQPGVSRLIGDLEKSLEFKLFERRRGRLIATPEGTSFYQELEKSLVGLDKLRRAAQEIREMRRGHLRVAAQPAVALDLLPETISRFLAVYPNLKVTLEVLTSSRIVEGVSARHFDLGFGQTTLEEPGVDVLQTLRTNCVCVVPAGHRFADQETVTLEDMKDEPSIALAQHTLAAMEIDHAFMDANVRRDIRVETHPSFAACAMVSKGIGVAVVDPMTASSYHREDLIVRRFSPDIHFDFRILRPSNTIMSKAAQEFVQTAVEVFRDYPFVTPL